MTRLCCLAALLLAAAPSWSATIEVPIYPEPEDNAFDHYLQATKLFPKPRPWDDAVGGLDELGPNEAELIVADAGDVLEEFRLGLDKECLMPGGGDFSTTFPYLADFRSLTRLLMVESQARMDAGDVPAAVGSCLDALKLGRDIARGGPIIHKLVSIACEGSALRRIRALAPMVGEEAPLVQLVARLGEVEAGEIPLSETLAIEWDWTRRSLQKCRDDAQERARIGEALGKPGLQPDDATLDDALVQLEAYYSELIAVAQTDYWVRTPDDVPLPRGNVLAEAIVPAVGRTREKEVRHLADLRATLIAAALELYLARAGAYPRTLAELIPEAVAAVPLDPFNGDSFCYRRDGELAYTLYSVGPNGVDDGGAGAGPDGEALDIVFSAVE